MTSQSDKKVTFVLNVHQFQLVVNFSISQGKGYYELRLIWQLGTMHQYGKNVEYLKSCEWS